jgi:hypothetical protein
LQIFRYFGQLLGLFLKWWWAALTGVASILSWLTVPETGTTMTRTSVAVLVFVVLTLAFLTLSTVVSGYRWFVGSLSPRVVRFVPASIESEAPCTFIVDPRPTALVPGYLISLYRNVLGEEVCIALLRFDRLREDGNAQCTPIWIGPGHLQELSNSSLDATSLRVRRDVPIQVVERLKAS